MAKKARLDLHGFKVDEVESAVDAFLHRHIQLGTKRVQIMTGKGKGLVKSTVISYLKKGGFPWKYEMDARGKVNEGVLEIFLNDGH